MIFNVSPQNPQSTSPQSHSFLVTCDLASVHTDSPSLTRQKNLTRQKITGQSKIVLLSCNSEVLNNYSLIIISLTPQFLSSEALVAGYVW